jgi:hypothetical protein
LLRDERRAVVSWIADNFRSSPIGQCALCGDGKRDDDPFVLVFVGEERAELHSSCHPAWVAEQEAEGCAALGIDPPDKGERSARAKHFRWRVAERRRSIRPKGKEKQ